MKDKLIKLYHWLNTWTGTVVIVLLVIFFLAQAFIIPSGSMKKTLLPGDALFAKKFAYGVPIPHIPWIEIPVLPDFKGNGHLIEGPRPKRGDIVIFRFPLDIKKHFVKRDFAGNGDEVIYNEEGFWLHPKEGDEYVKKNFKGFKIKEFMGKLYVLNPYMKEHKGIQYINQNGTFLSLKYNAEKLLEFSGINNYTGVVDYDTVKKMFDNYLLFLKMQGYDLSLNDLLRVNKDSDYFIFPIGMGIVLEEGRVKYFYSKFKKDEFLMIGDNRDESLDSRFWGPVSYKYIVGKPWFIYMSWVMEDEENAPKYTIRWNRVGKTVDEIEKELKEGKKPYITAGCEE